MVERSTRECVLEFIDGFYAGDAARVEACCDDTFKSLTHSPVEIFPHHGIKQGRAWIAESIRLQSQRYAERRHKLIFIAVDGLRAATICEASLTKRSDGRVVHLTLADFFILGGGLIREHHHFLDSLDLMQQLLGRDLSEPLAAMVQEATRR